MLHKTQGIILHTTNYSETSIIAKIYTRQFGVQSYIVSGTRSKKSNKRSQLLQPLTLLEMVVSNSEKTSLQRINEFTVAYHYSDLPSNILKSSIAIFLNEVLYKSLKEEHKDEELFDFIFHSFQILDLTNENYMNFHLSFMLQLSKFLGFYPQGEYSSSYSVFDLIEGKYINSLPAHQLFLRQEESECLFKLLKLSYEDAGYLKLSSAQRERLLAGIVKFYQLHISTFGEMKTVEVLRQILN